MSMTGLSNSPRERAELLVDGILRDFHHAMRRVVNIYGNGNEVMDGVIMPEAMRAMEAAGLVYDDSSEKKADEETSYTGERRDLCQLVNLGFSRVSWDRTIDILASCYARKNKADKFVKPGDYIDIPVAVEYAKIMDCDFPSIRTEAARLVVTAVFPDKIILNFEDVITYAPMNSDSTNAGGFAATALAKYLNTKFLESVFSKVKQFLAPNKDGLKVSLPTRFEVFGAGPENANWGEAVRHEYFEKCTNRIKVGIDDKDDTKYWWNYDPYPSYSSTFCRVNSDGLASYYYAGNTSGGVSPAICIS